jgi:uncharacterized protein (DUF2384 family)
MAVAFLRLTEPAGESGPETAASEALKRSAPLLLVTDTIDDHPGIHTAVLIVKPPSDGPQLPIWLSDEWNNRTMFRVAAYVVAGTRDAVPVQSLLDKYVADIREQIGSSAAPLFFYDPSTDEIPNDLRVILTDLTREMTPLETLDLPVFIEAAGGEQRAETLINRAIEARGGDAESALETFALETRGVLEGTTDNWSFDSAVSWLRSPNAFLNGARPIDVLALEGSRSVVDAAYGATWSLFG